MGNIKKPVICIIEVNGTVTKKINQTRVVYTDKLGSYVKVLTAKKYLNSNAEYVLKFTSVTPTNILHYLATKEGN